MVRIGHERADMGNDWSIRNNRPIYREPDHPLSDNKGWVYEHRAVALALWGSGTQACHWCGMPLEWDGTFLVDRLCVDHLDGDRSNNEESNLVPACQECNLQRGKSPWVCVRRALKQQACTPQGSPRRPTVDAALARSLLAVAAFVKPKKVRPTTKRGA